MGCRMYIVYYPDKYAGTADCVGFMRGKKQ